MLNLICSHMTYQKPIIKHWKILAGGVNAWNAWRDQKPTVKPKLIALMSSHVACQLEEITKGFDIEVHYSWNPVHNVTQLHLQNVNLSNTTLSSLSLESVNLFNADLRGANLNRCALDNAILQDTDFRGASLDQVRFQGANLMGANFEGVDLSRVNLCGANLAYANLRHAKLPYGYLSGGTIFIDANLEKANLQNAFLSEADLTRANLKDANLSEADLSSAVLVNTNFESANLSGARIFGASVWGCNLKGATQTDLIISPETEPTVTSDSLEVAQFLYLIMNNEAIRDVVDVVTSKAVLILGRFTPERKEVLERIREELRHKNLLPILFDFDKPASRDISETIALLAHMCGLIIADLTDAKSVPQELQIIAPNIPSTIIQPIIHYSQKEYGMFEHFKKYPWVKELFRYKNSKSVITHLDQHVLNK